MAESLLAQSLAVVAAAALAKVLDVLLLLPVRSASLRSLVLLLRNSRRPSPPANAVFPDSHCHPRSGLEEFSLR